MALYGLPYVAEAWSGSPTAVHTYLPESNLRERAPKSDRTLPTGTYVTQYDWSADQLGGSVPYVELKAQTTTTGVTFVQAQLQFPVGRYSNADDKTNYRPASITQGNVKVSLSIPTSDLDSTDVGTLRGLIDATAMILIANGSGVLGASNLNLLLRANTKIYS